MNQPIVAQKDTAMPNRVPDLQSPSYHFDQSNRERAAIGLPPQERIALAPESDDLDCVRELAECAIRHFPRRISPAQREKLDELFTAPSAFQRFDLLQADESAKAEKLANRVALYVFGVRGVKRLENRKQQDLCRFLARHAVRLTQDCWKREAERAARQAALNWMQHEGGARFRHLPLHELQHIAALLAPQVTSAYHGVSEGTVPVAPGKYLSIVSGGAK